MADSEEDVSFPGIEERSVTEDIEDVTIHIIEGDRSKTFPSDEILNAKELHATDEMPEEYRGDPATIVTFESHPDLMRGLSDATIAYTNGWASSGVVPQATMNGDQTELVIVCSKPEFGQDGGDQDDV